MADQTIQISGTGNQAMTVDLNVDGAILTLNLTFTFLEMANYWAMSIANSDNVLMLDSIPLLTGYYPANNLLASYVYLFIGSAYLVNISNTGEDYPSRTTLATDWALIWSDTGRV
jgi:hypothetical protein